MNSKTNITVSDFDKDFEGDPVQLFTLARSNELKACITNFGGILTELHVPDSKGEWVDVVLGFASIDDYISENTYAGAIVGRVAGRVTKGQFSIAGQTHQLTQNEGENHVHGGKSGFDKKLWDAEILNCKEGQCLQLSYLSPHGEEGFPGNLKVQVTYSLTESNGLHIDCKATTDAATPICLTDHSYFNLAGKENLEHHFLQVNAKTVVEVDDKFIPTGKKIPVEPGKNDFNTAAEFAKRIPLLHQFHGANYVLHPSEGKLRRVASLSYPPNRIQMQVLTTASNLQVYSGVGLQPKAKGKYGKQYQKFGGLCLECQGFSDALNHLNFEPIVLSPGEVFHQITEYRFSTV